MFYVKHHLKGTNFRPLSGLWDNNGFGPDFAGKRLEKGPFLRRS
jgi:hypothetical protein